MFISQCFWNFILLLLFLATLLNLLPGILVPWAKGEVLTAKPPGNFLSVL